jgi:hypothetical protein
MRRAGLVQLVSASSPSHQVLGSKPSLCRISAEVRLCFGYSLPQTPLVWEPLALGLPFFIDHEKTLVNLGGEIVILILHLSKLSRECLA